MNPLARILQVLNITTSPPPRRSRFVDHVEANEEAPAEVSCACCHDPIPEGDEERCTTCGQVFCPDCFDEHECPNQEAQNA